MSLVEQAARRLEALRKAGLSVGESSYPVEEAPSTAPESGAEAIEQAVERLRGSADGLLISDSSSQAGAEELSFAHAEPGIAVSESVVEAPSVCRPQNRQPSRLTRKLEINLERLSAAGYLTPEKTESGIANELRRIKRPLINACHGKLANPIRHANRIMVTSSLPGEGKSFISLNLAISVAMERDSTVLLIDADTSRPSLSHLIGAANDLGLLDLLTRDDLDAADTLVRTNIDRLAFLPAGVQRPHATELLASEVMAKLVEELASRYSDRILIFDAPPLLAASEPAVLASHMGQIVVVVEAQRTTHRALQQALNTIDSCPAVMTVLNKAATEDNGKYVYFG
ncbi:MAG TPA: XrtA-associated tyrosine autokinase [Burkholderiales bacterium]|nr:XrtA-associated tyrosine autokinase [Burkholderiales bacterium]